MQGNYLLFALVFFPMAAALIAYLIGRRSKEGRNVFVMLCGLAELALMLYAAVSTVGSTLHFSWSGFCSLGIRFELDDFRRVYATVAALMWAMTLLFSREYFAHYRNRNRYYFFNLMTLGATMGVFLSQDLATTLVFFEIMSFTSYTWVAHEETPGAMRAANTYLAVAVIGGLSALMGLFLLYHHWVLWRSRASMPQPRSVPTRAPSMRRVSASWSASAQRRACFRCISGCPRPIPWPRLRPARCSPAS